MVKFVETEGWGLGAGEMGSCFMGRVSVLQDENSLGDRLYNSIQNYMLIQS